MGGRRPRYPGWAGRGLESGNPKQNEHREQKSLHRRLGGRGVAVEQALNGAMLNGAMLEARIDRWGYNVSSFQDDVFQGDVILEQGDARLVGLGPQHWRPGEGC